MAEIFNPYQAQIEQLTQEIASNENLLQGSEFNDNQELKQLVEDEIVRLKSERNSLEEAANAYLAAQEKTEDGSTLDSNASAIIEIRGGAGGDEAKIWAADILRMYLRLAENLHLKVELIDDLIFKIKGRSQLRVLEVKKDGEELSLTDNGETETLSAFELFRFESGVHRVQRVPSTEAAGRIHTSTASVAVLPEVAAQQVEIRDDDLEWQFMRSGGAGGQSVNKTSSAVRLTHRPTGIVVNARQERKQAQNRQIALELLRSQLWQIEEDKRLEEMGDARQSIGRNMRAEKIKTYNFPQNRLTDHRIHHSWHNLEQILEGDLIEVIENSRALILHSS